ncbi:MAG: hypothetical protein P8X63_10955 [Desulfuromonadaceae bacterium]
MDKLEQYRQAISPRTALLPMGGLRQMIALVRTLYRLSRLPAYQAEIFRQLPEIARTDPRHDAVMMGYDFHWTAKGPQLIEVNTNAGGWFLALLAQFGSSVMDPAALPRRMRARLLGQFSAELRRWSAGRLERPALMAIIDEQPEAQFLYGEMEYFRRLVEAHWRIPLVIVDPGDLEAGAQGVFHRGRRIELIYNRHCDFYLQGEAMAGIRAACRQRRLCLTPHPFSYGLLADKRRLALWSDPQKLRSLGVSEADMGLLGALVPESRLLRDLDREQLWRQRGDWVFKPVDCFGSRGVLLGRKITRGRYLALAPEETLVQRWVPPSLTGDAEDAMKTDFRLYVYGQRVLGVAARLYQGQVTNLRTPGGGFAPVRLV